jgi:hypothetical protein
MCRVLSGVIVGRVAAGANWLTQMAGNTRKSKRKGPTRCQRVNKKKEMKKKKMMMMGDGRWKCTERDGDEKDDGDESDEIV